MDGRYGDCKQRDGSTVVPIAPIGDATAADGVAPITNGPTNLAVDGVTNGARVRIGARIHGTRARPVTKPPGP